MRLLIRGTWSCEVFTRASLYSPGSKQGTTKESFRCEVDIKDDDSVSGVFFRGEEQKGTPMVGLATSQHGANRSMLMIPEGQSAVELSVMFHLWEDPEGGWHADNLTVQFPTTAILALNGVLDAEVRVEESGRPGRPQEVQQDI